ncbi:MAG: lamin tail domain-containing protein [Bacteroidota bacterium]
MKRSTFTFLFTFCFFFLNLTAQDVVITEISYNNPSVDDYEYIELHNKGTSDIDMTGWSFSTGIDFTFPSYTLNAGGYVVVAIDSVAFEMAFNQPAFQNASGQLSNGGEAIVLNDAMGAVVDSVDYDDTAPWPSDADGGGPSLSLCDPDADNSDPANWIASVTPTGFSVGGTEFLGTPGTVNCSSDPVISFFVSAVSVQEDGGIANVVLLLNNGNANVTEVTVELDGNSTATNGDDYMLSLPLTITFDAGVTSDTQSISIPIVDDMDMETVETIILELTNPTNNASVSSNNQFTMSIVDNDTPVSMLITGVFDTQVDPSAGTWSKGVELQALVDIPDISSYGLGSANNGNGSGGEETTFPALSVLAGDCIYVVNDSALFFDFFGTADFVISGGAANINGNDAIELFQNGAVIDVFGEINVDGTGQPWDYMDGWAYRNSGTGPDGTVFNLNNWTFSGIDIFDGAPDNASAQSPFPTCSYSTMPPNEPIANDDNATTDIDQPVTISVLTNDQTPNALTSMQVTSGPDNGMVTVNGVSDITYTPDPGFCGADAFIYEICDMNGCDEAFVNITVNCPVSYPPYDIALVTTVDGTGEIDSLDVTCELQGIVHGIDFQGNDSIQFALIDNTGGINIFGTKSFGYTVTEGDELIIRGRVSEFFCMTQFSVDTLIEVSSGNALETPIVTTFLNETFESELVKLTNLDYVDISEWAGDGSSFNVQVTNGSFTNTMRIDSDTELASMPPPQAPFHATGLGAQFDSDGPCDSGYQFFPRYADDIEELNNVVDPTLSEKIDFYPNPVTSTLRIDAEVKLANVQIANLLGQVVLNQSNPGNELDVNALGKGIYLITFQVGESIWTDKLVKE